MAKAIVAFSITDTGYTIGSVTIGHCNRIDTGAAINTSGSTLTHQSNGQYILDIPNVTVSTGRASFYLYVTTDPSKYVEGDIAPEIEDTIWDETLTGATHNVANSAGRRVRAMQEYEGYFGKIWVDTVNGVAGTTLFENGTSTNPVNSVADALVLAAATKFTTCQVANGSSIILSADCSGHVFLGHAWTLALGGQNITGARFFDATVSGIASGSGAPHFAHCTMGICTIPPCIIHDGDIQNVLTLLAGNYYIDQCYTDGNASLDFSTAGNTNVYFSHFDGHIEIKNLGNTGTDVVDITGNGEIVLNANCIGGTVYVHGRINVVDNSGGAVTVVDDPTNLTVAEMISGGIAIESSSQTIIGYLQGQGNRTVTVQLYITGGTTPIPNATVTVMNSLDNVFLSQLTTNAAGQATMARNDGTYKLRVSCPGYTFTTPMTLTVAGSGTHIFYGDGVPMPVAPAANMQNLVGNVRRLNWAVGQGEVIKAYIDGKQFVNSSLVLDYKLSATVDVNGDFLLLVPCNSQIRVDVPHHGTYDISVNSTSGTVNISTYIL